MSWAPASACFSVPGMRILDTIWNNGTKIKQPEPIYQVFFAQMTCSTSLCDILMHWPVLDSWICVLYHLNEMNKGSTTIGTYWAKCEPLWRGPALALCDMGDLTCSASLCDSLMLLPIGLCGICVSYNLNEMNKGSATIGTYWAKREPLWWGQVFSLCDMGDLTRSTSPNECLKSIQMRLCGNCVLYHLKQMSGRALEHQSILGRARTTLARSSPCIFYGDSLGRPHLTAYELPSLLDGAAIIHRDVFYDYRIVLKIVDTIWNNGIKIKQSEPI